MSAPPKRILAIIAALLAVTAGGGTILITADPDDDPKVPSSTITVPVDGLDADNAPDQTLTVPQAAVDEATRALTGSLGPQGFPRDRDADHTESRDETPTGAQAAELADNTDAIAQNQRTTDALPTAGASQGFAGCRTSFVRNQSGRRGVRPTIQVLHYTVSPNRVGWSDVNAIVSFFNSPSAQASSNFVIDAEGHCAYIVPIEAKAWTQAGGNPWSISYEIIAMGNEPVYLPAAGIAKLRSVTREVARRTGIPMSRGAVSGCAPSRSGIVQHKDGGTCWGGHGDIGPFPFAAIAASLIAGSNVSATDRATCRKLNAWRNAGRPHGGTWERNSIRRRGALDKRGVTCLKSGPVKR